MISLVFQLEIYPYINNTCINNELIISQKLTVKTVLSNERNYSCACAILPIDFLLKHTYYEKYYYRPQSKAVTSMHSL